MSLKGPLHGPAHCHRRCAAGNMSQDSGLGRKRHSSRSPFDEDRVVVASGGGDRFRKRLDSEPPWPRASSPCLAFADRLRIIMQWERKRQRHYGSHIRVARDVSQRGRAPTVRSGSFLRNELWAAAFDEAAVRLLNSLLNHQGVEEVLGGPVRVAGAHVGPEQWK